MAGLCATSGRCPSARCGHHVIGVLPYMPVLLLHTGVIERVWPGLRPARMSRLSIRAHRTTGTALGKGRTVVRKRRALAPESFYRRRFGGRTQCPRGTPVNPGSGTSGQWGHLYRVAGASYSSERVEPPSRWPDKGPGGARSRSHGQSVLEFALVLPVLLVLLGGAVQFGVIFAAKNTLTQIARDTARWAATQVYSPCSAATTSTPAQPLTQADSTASVSSLIGYTSGTWYSTGTWVSGTSGNFTAYADNTVLPPSPPSGEGVEVVWSFEPGGVCPPSDNALPAYVTVRVTHAVPVFLPGLQYLPSLGACDATGCHISLSATSMFRMEPPRQ